MTEVTAGTRWIPDNPRKGEDNRPATWHASRTYEPADAKGVAVVPAQTYEITFTGRAGTTLRAEFDDCQVTVGPDTTTLRADLPDQVALCGLVQRITGFGLDIVHLHLIIPASAPEPISLASESAACHKTA